MGRTWQIFARICLLCGQNLSSGDIANFSCLQKLRKSAKHQRHRSAWVGQADFRKL